MAGSVNKVILVGNVGRDPEVRSTQGGQKVVQLSIATSESWKDKQTGERQEKTEWHRVVIWNENIADVVERYVRKGTSVYVEGQLQTRKWTDQQSGQERYSTEVVIQKFKGELTLLGGRGEGAAEQPAAQPRGNGGGGSYRQDAPRGGGRQQPQRSSRIEDDLDDSIPF